MKKLILIIGVILLSVSFSFGQTKQITVNENDLPSNVLSEIKMKQEMKMMEEKIEHYGKWVGVGGEIGGVIRDGLFAVKDVAVEFSDTKVGEYTMLLVAWKVMGKDIIRIILGLLMVITSVILIWRSYILNYTTRRVKKIDNGWMFWKPNEYQYIQPENFDGINVVKFLHLLAIVGSFGISFAIMFAEHGG